MVSYVQLVTTKPAIKRIAESLKIPTVRTCKVIRVKKRSSSVDLSDKENMCIGNFIKRENIEDNEDNNLTLNKLNFEQTENLPKIKQEPTDFDLNFEDFDLTKPFNNPNNNIYKSEDLDLDFEFLQTVPFADTLSEGILTNDQIYESLGYNEKDLEKLMGELSPKPKSLDQEDENSNTTQYTNQSEFEATKKRKRSIYRADDVTTEEDLLNYLERRKKNNISSKASRAIKKVLQ